MERGRVIGIVLIGLEWREVAHELRHLAFTRLRERVGLIAEDGVAHVVAFAQRGLGEMDGGVHGVVELAIVADAGAHETAAVDHDDQPLVALRLVMAADEPPTLGGGLPVDGAEIVIGLMFAQRFELAAFASTRGPAASRASRPRQRKLQILRTFAGQVGNDLHPLRQLDLTLTHDQPQGPGDAEKDGAKSKWAAPVTSHFVGALGGFLRTQTHGNAAALAGKFRGRRIDNHERGRLIAAIGQAELYRKGLRLAEYRWDAPRDVERFAREIKDVR